MIVGVNCSYWSVNCSYWSFLLFSLQTIVCCQIEIKELDDFAQAAFRGYKSLNRIQSRIFQTVYHTNENILVSSLFLNMRISLKWIFAFNISEVFFVHLQVCAPTGAGKTNIAMISILHEVRNHLAVPWFLCYFGVLDFLVILYILRWKWKISQFGSMRMWNPWARCAFNFSIWKSS